MLAVALLNLADDHGYFKSHPAVVAGAVMPFDKDGQRFASAGMLELERVGFLELYEGHVGKVANFADHQRIAKPSKSKLQPKAITRCRENSEFPQKNSESSKKISQEVEVEVEQGNGTGKCEAPPPDAVLDPLLEKQKPPDLAEDIFNHWREKTGSHKAKFDSDRRKLIEARVRQGYSPLDLKACIDGYCTSPHHLGQNDRGKKYLSLELMLRDAEHVDAGLRYLEVPVLRPRGATQESEYVGGNASFMAGVGQ